MPSDYTEEELAQEITVTLSVRDALLNYRVLSARIRDKQNGLRNMLAKEKPPHIIGFQKNQIHQLTQLRRVYDDALAELD